MGNTIILGASTNPSRYAFKVASLFFEKGLPFIPVGIKKGVLFGETILDLREKPFIEDVDTITMYIGPEKQNEWLDYILSLNPKRIIFNPGTENKVLMDLARDKKITVLQACNLVMLSTGQF